MTTPRVQPFSRRVGVPAGAVFGRVYVALLIVQLPLLAVLLTPQSRSRVSSESVAGVLTVVLIGLVLAGLVVSPAVCARVAPGGARWRAGSALSTVRALRRDDRRAYLLRLGEWAGIYVLAQCLGGLSALVRPYIWDNPRFGADPAADRWVFHYGNYATQGVVIYLAVCAATAWYACRLRQLATDGR
ncbi:hypothetical protein [Streptomyces sp. SCA2-2]|uniref:hypothetical protein n=1 Tax=Streptomyces sp. SCA2-2 TaxID=1563677 RepID=UPI001020B139|nr:hypothetical protein [Streptomyces sp. SCA2-2]